MRNRLKFGVVSLLLIAAAAVLSLAPASAAHAFVVPLYSKFEVSFQLPGVIGNLFDPAENDVDGVFTGPRAERVIVPAFWDGTVWRIRFTPQRTGSYHLRVMRNGEAIAPVGLTASGFRCVSSASDPGFVRCSPRAVQQFVFDDGRVYYPLGINVAWQNNENQSYPIMFGHMRDAGMNWARVWMNAWDGKNLEWSSRTADSPKIGYYSMDAARRWDEIINLAERDGVYVQMTLQHHGQYTAHTDPNWAGNPFNAANGGFLKNPDDFFTDPRAIALTKAKYRYIVARWGYSTHLLAFELFNEVQNITEANSHFSDVVDWHRKMAAYLRSIDPYRHLITTSYTPSNSPLASAGIDYLQLHEYVPDIVSTIEATPVTAVTKPIFIGEWGTSGGVPLSTQILHDGLWASIATPTAGAAEFWYWDNMDRLEGWREYRSASSFLKTFRVPALADLGSVHVQAESPGPRADLTFAPPLGWAPTTTKDVFVSRDGRISGIEGMSSFLQGSGNRKLEPYPIVFHLDAAAPSSFVVRFGQAAAGGAHPTLILDGEQATKRVIDFPASGKNRDVDQPVSIDVPAGAHTVTLFNTGADWATISRITVAHYAPAIAAVGRGNGRSAVFWAYCRAGQGDTVKGGHLTVGGMQNGRYSIRLWSPSAGHSLSPIAANVKNRTLSINMPDVRGDIAGVAVKQ